MGYGPSPPHVEGEGTGKCTRFCRDVKNSYSSYLPKGYIQINFSLIMLAMLFDQGVVTSYALPRREFGAVFNFNSGHIWTIIQLRMSERFWVGHGDLSENLESSAGS